MNKVKIGNLSLQVGQKKQVRCYSGEIEIVAIDEVGRLPRGLEDHGGHNARAFTVDLGPYQARAALCVTCYNKKRRNIGLILGWHRSWSNSKTFLLNFFNLLLVFPLFKGEQEGVTNIKLKEKI